MDEIEYVFGVGDGVVHVWSSVADLELARSGAPDAVRLDFDGDGFADDALWDTSDTGVADVAALDLDDDGLLDHFFTDPSGLGVWDHEITGSPEDAAKEPLAWIVRTSSFPDMSSETNNVVAADLSAVSAEYPARPEAFAGSLSDPDDLMGHSGPLPDQRGRLLADGCAESAADGG